VSPAARNRPSRPPESRSPNRAPVSSAGSGWPTAAATIAH